MGDVYTQKIYAVHDIEDDLSIEIPKVSRGAVQRAVISVPIFSTEDDGFKLVSLPLALFLFTHQAATVKQELNDLKNRVYALENP